MYPKKKKDKQILLPQSKSWKVTASSRGFEFD
jgi:hypothetical protein